MNDNKNIPFVIIDKIKKEVVKKLGVESIFKLYDKFDGVFYLNKQLKRILASYVISKKISLPLINEEKILLSTTKFEYNNKIYSIQGVELNDKIKIPNESVDIFIVVGFFDDFRKYKILGAISKEECLKYKETSKNSNSLISKDILAVINKENLNYFENV
jgi:hypothetical protein